MKQYKWIAALLGLSVCLTGCIGGPVETPTSEGNAQDSALEYWVKLETVHSTSVSTLNDLPMYQKMQEETGVEIKFVHPPAGQESEQYNLMVASKDYPDIIERAWASDAGGPEKAIKDGIIMPLNDLVEQSAPDYNAILQQDNDIRRTFYTDDGNLYGFGVIDEMPYMESGGMFIRRDWLEELGLEIPTNMDEWEVMLEAFKTQKGAEAPFTTDSYRITNAMLFLNCYGIGTGFYEAADGSIQYGPAQPQYKEYLTKMNKWFEKGYIDNGAFTIDNSVVQSKILNSQAGSFYGFIGSTLGTLLAAAPEGSFDLAAVPFPALGSSKEYTYYTEKEPLYDENGELKSLAAAKVPAAVITTTNKNPEQSAKFLNYLYTEQGRMLKNFGVEGDTYTMQGDYPTYTDKVLNDPDGIAVANAMGKYFRASYPNPGYSNVPAYIEQYYKYDQQKEALEVFGHQYEYSVAHGLPALTPTSEETEEVSAILETINTYKNEMFAKFIMGTESLDNFDAYVQTLKDMNLERIIEIYTQALQRYESR